MKLMPHESPWLKSKERNSNRVEHVNPQLEAGPYQATIPLFSQRLKRLAPVPLEFTRCTHEAGVSPTHLQCERHCPTLPADRRRMGIRGPI
jgi:hypothetical protein